MDTHLAVSPNTFYTIITSGEESSESLGTILLTDDHVAPAPGQLRLRFVNAASTVGPMDLYFASGPNAGLPFNPSVPALGYKSPTSYFSFAAPSFNAAPIRQTYLRPALEASAESARIACFQSLCSFNRWHKTV